MKLARIWKSLCAALVSFAILMAPSYPLFAAPPQAAAAAALPTAEQVLEKYVAAIGGRDAYKKLTSRQIKATMEFAPGVVATLEALEKAPDKVVVTVEIQGMTIREGFDGKVGWSHDPNNGLKEKAGTELAEAARESNFYEPIEMHKLYTKLAVRDRAELDGRPVYRLDGTVVDGTTEVLYFDVETGLLVKKESVKPGPPVERTEFTFEDYKEIDGIKFPFASKLSGGGRTMVMRATEVKHNIPIEDSQFAKPGTP